MASFLPDSVFSLTVIGGAVCLALAALYWALRLRRHNLQLNDRVNNMSQGLCMFDASARLVVGNKRYLEIYGLSPEKTKPGCSLRDLIKQRIDSGTFSGDPDKYIAATMQENRPGQAGQQNPRNEGRPRDRAVQPADAGRRLGGPQTTCTGARATEPPPRIGRLDSAITRPSFISRNFVDRGLPWPISCIVAAIYLSGRRKRSRVDALL